MNNITSFFSSSSRKSPFEALLSPHINQLYQQAYHYTGRAADAEDLLQDLLVELFTKQEKMRGSANLGAWLNRCLYNRFIDRYRKTRRFSNHDDIDSLSVRSQLCSSDSPETACYNKQIRDGISQLNATQRAVVSLHDICGFTLPEVSDILDVPLGTLKSHLHRSRKKLKKNLDLQPFNESSRQLQQRLEK